MKEKTITLEVDETLYGEFALLADSAGQTIEAWALDTLIARWEADNI
jgi:hypothetical protein